jgi:nitroimidazol reductase NimA-like FMN-containing flavoprotein (pyridoxamine 5'-phosphate oxidase superfamily)
MIIRELTRPASLDLLTRGHLGRLACARANQPYVVPIFFAYHENSLYCATTLGQKIEWMRENPLVAVEVDEIDSAEQWQSVVVSGRYEEFADTPEMGDMRQLAWWLLHEANPLWWEPA